MKRMTMAVATLVTGLAFAAPVEKPNDAKVHHGKNRNWKIVNGEYEGCEARAGRVPLDVFAYKWQLISDWSRFAHQAGPYVLGQNAPSIIEHDRAVYKDLWQAHTAEWILTGERAWRLTRMIQAHPDRGSLNVVVNFNAPVHLPTALVAEMFWSADEPWPVILRRVLNRCWMNAEATDK